MAESPCSHQKSSIHVFFLLQLLPKKSNCPALQPRGCESYRLHAVRSVEPLRPAWSWIFCDNYDTHTQKLFYGATVCISIVVCVAWLRKQKSAMLLEVYENVADCEVKVKCVVVSDGGFAV